MNTALLILLGIVVVIVLVCTAFEFGRRFQRELAKARGENPGPDIVNNSGPQIIVNVPADCKPLESLPETSTISGERARLWWTVYEKTLDDINCTGSDEAIDAANEAVEKVYGEVVGS